MKQNKKKLIKKQNLKKKKICKINKQKYNTQNKIKQK